MLNPPPPPSGTTRETTLDRAFGQRRRDEEEAEAESGGRAAGRAAKGRPARAAPAGEAATSGSRWHSSDRAAGYMFPLVVTAALVLTVTYSLNKSIQYPELFRTDARYRAGLLIANGGIVAVCVALIAYSQAAVRREENDERKPLDLRSDDSLPTVSPKRPATNPKNSKQQKRRMARPSLHRLVTGGLIWCRCRVRAWWWRRRAALRPVDPPPQAATAAAEATIAKIGRAHV